MSIERIDRNIDKIDKKIDTVLERLLDHGELLAKHGVLHERNADQLELHIKRTNLLEAKLEKDMEVALLPIKSFKFLIKLTAGILTIVTVLKLTGVI